jgi:predicted small lipoprotein YifL
MKRLSILLATLLFIVAGCGQSGPLYLSGNPSEVQVQPPAAESSAESTAESTAEEEQEENGDDDDKE